MARMYFKTDVKYEKKKQVSSLNKIHGKSYSKQKLQLYILNIFLVFSLVPTISNAEISEEVAYMDGDLLVLPQIVIGKNTWFNVSLEKLSNGNLTLVSHEGKTKKILPSVAVFKKGRIYINVLNDADEIISNVRYKYIAGTEYEFKLESFDTPLLTSDISFENRNTNLWVDYVTVRDPIIREKISKDYETCDCEYYGVGYADFDLDGDDDLLISTVWWGDGIDLSDYTLENYRTIPIEMYLNKGKDAFEYTENLFINTPTLADTTRRVIVSDFNNDVYPDFLLVATGFDAKPYPGATPTLVISDISGNYYSRKIDNKQHFLHGAASGDIDSDGDSDIVATSFDGVLLYENDGNGNFSKSTIDYFKDKYGIFHVEIFDFNDDSYLDIITTGHVWKTNTQIVFGPDFVNGMEINNSELTQNHVVNDIQFADLDGDGINEIIQSTTGGESEFYQGAYIEIIYFDEEMNQESNQIVYENPDRRGGVDRTSPKWIWWLKIADIDEDGNLDIMEDDKHDGTILLNTGNRNFVLRTE